MSNFEKLERYTDKYPFLKFRKFLVLLYLYLNHFCYLIVKHPIFEFLSMVIILINSVFLTFDSSSSTDSISDRSEFTFMALYTVEMSLKILGYGFYRGPNSILKDSWNLFDFIIVLMSWLNYFL